MLTLTLSKVVGDQFNISLCATLPNCCWQAPHSRLTLMCNTVGCCRYDMHVEIKCIPFLEFKPPAGMEQLHAEDLMSAPVVTFDEVESAETIYKRLQYVRRFDSLAFF